MITDAIYVYSGLSRDKWDNMSVMLIKSYIDNPELLDSLSDKFVAEFFRYFDDYHYKFKINPRQFN